MLFNIPSSILIDGNIQMFLLNETFKKIKSMIQTQDTLYYIFITYSNTPSV